MHKLVLHFFKDNSGATAKEYALIAAGISMGIIAAVQSLGTILKGTFNGVANALQFGWSWRTRPQCVLIRTKQNPGTLPGVSLCSLSAAPASAIPVPFPPTVQTVGTTSSAA